MCGRRKTDRVSTSLSSWEESSSLFPLLGSFLCWGIWRQTSCGSPLRVSPEHDLVPLQGNVTPGCWRDPIAAGLACSVRGLSLLAHHTALHKAQGHSISCHKVPPKALAQPITQWLPSFLAPVHPETDTVTPSALAGRKTWPGV